VSLSLPVSILAIKHSSSDLSGGIKILSAANDMNNARKGNV